MRLSRKRIICICLMLLTVFPIITTYEPAYSADTTTEKKVRLYWFIPDGMRAEPELFNIYQWAQDGELPNIKHIMEHGSYGYCKPVYPGHTPVNFATLFTGSFPETHGVADGPMHTEGQPLSKPSIVGFSSTAKKVEPIWVTLEKRGKKITLLSLPGSTPPELKKGVTVVGRWGGWGANFYAVNFEELGSGKSRYEQGNHARLFYFGPPLVIYKHAAEVDRHGSMPHSFIKPKEVFLEAWGGKIGAYIYASSKNARSGYNRIAFFVEKDRILADLKEGEWSTWVPIQLKWNNVNFDTQVKIKVIKLGKDGFFRVRFYYNCANESVTDPSYIYKDIMENVGPMVDTVDNFPPQLIFYNEDKDTFLEESAMSFEWHKHAASYFLKNKELDVFIHDIYSPNQMLTSKWWMGYVDPKSPRYNRKTDQEKAKLWAEVKHMYKMLDDIIGEYIKNADENTIIAFGSDHGNIPLHTLVHLNNLFAQKGWLKFKKDPETGEPIVDWGNSQVVYLKFDNIYVNPKGLHDKDGKWRRASGADYDTLRKEVAKTITDISDSKGIHPLVKIANWEDAEIQFRLPNERVGDLVIANRPGYSWTEDMSEDKILFSESMETGYKQSIIPDEIPGMWCPFMIMGPGVKKGYFMGDKPISMTDVYPTLMRLIGQKCPEFVQGKEIKSIFIDEQRMSTNEDNKK